MPYKVTGKNLAVGRLMVRGKDAEKRLKYLHVSPKGTTVITTEMVARVSLPAGQPAFGPQRVIPQEQIDTIDSSPFRDDLIELPEGEPAITGPQFLVPDFDFPGPESTTAEFTCNGNLLRKLLTVAGEVSRDSQSIVRLRFCKDLNSLRVDIYRQPGHQEFCGALKGIKYDGSYIPGELASGEAKQEKRPEQAKMVLKVATGRKFRGVGE
jgi:hypothetical protein